MFLGDSSFLRQSADSFGMTTFVFLDGGKGRAAGYRRSPLSPIDPDKALSFRTLARNLNFKLLDFVVITIGVQEIE